MKHISVGELVSLEALIRSCVTATNPTFITSLIHPKRTSSLPSSTLVENVGVLMSVDLESGVIDISDPILPYWVRTTNM